MHKRSSRISQSVAYAARTLFFNELPVSSSPKCFFSAVSGRASFQKLPKLDIPGDFLKWASLGFCRTSKFATGFTPLQPKPLDSIVDFERVKDRSPEEIASIWDDVMLHLLWIILPALCLANRWDLIQREDWSLFTFLICSFWAFGLLWNAER